MDELIVVGRPDQGHEVDAVYAVVGIDPEGNEGIVGGGNTATGLVPWVFSKYEVVRKIKPALEQIKSLSPGFRFVLRKFSDPQDIETL